MNLRLFTLLTVGVLTHALASNAAAATGELRLAVEPGISTLKLQSSTQPAERVWGALGAVSAAIGLTDLVWLQIHADRKSSLSHKPRLATNAWGATLVYNIDLLRVTPFVELGVGRVHFSPAKGIPLEQADSTLIPILGAGFDVSVADVVCVGAVARYHALFDSGLLDNPAFFTLHGRLGVILDFF